MFDVYFHLKDLIRIGGNFVRNPPQHILDRKTILENVAQFLSKAFSGSFFVNI